MEPFASLLADIRSCTICADELPLGPRPVVQLDPHSRILVVGQAPGRRVHASGVPFDDPSGDRLRDWMGIGRDTFYDPAQVAVLPMGFCYPGTGPSGDLPPRPECAPAWRRRVLERLVDVRLTLVIGRYALDYHLPDAGPTVSEAVAGWQDHWPTVVPLPHPSPRNNRWLKEHPWFVEDLVPRLRDRVAAVLAGPDPTGTR